MGILADPMCYRCKRDKGGLIHLLWRCPKGHRYWTAVLGTHNRVFQCSVPLDPKYCLLGILSDFIPEEPTRVAINRTLFQAYKILLLIWKSPDPPSYQMWVTNMGHTLIFEKYLYQHRGCSGKFERLWARWLDTPGLP